MHASLVALRKAFPALDEGLSFCDWGSHGLLPAPTRVALDAYLDDLARCPTAEGGWMHGPLAGVREAARAGVATRIGAGKDEIALVESTTFGLNAAVESVPMSPGDGVLLSAIDYPAVWTPWKQRRLRDEIELDFVPPRGGCLEADDVVERIDERTRVIALSTACWTTGALVDLETIGAEARMRGIVLMVDGIQTFPVVPIDVKSCGASFLAVGGHKWLCSPAGTGFLFVERQKAARLQPKRVGFLSGRPPRGADWGAYFQDPEAGPDDEILFPATARTYETGGTACYPGSIALAQALTLFAAVPADVLLEHVRDLGDQLMAGLDARGLAVLTPRERERRGGAVVFNHPDGVDAEVGLSQKLRERRVAVSVRYGGGVGGVRVSLHGMNTDEDVQRVLDAL